MKSGVRQVAGQTRGIEIIALGNAFGDKFESSRCCGLYEAWTTVLKQNGRVADAASFAINGHWCAVAIYISADAAQLPACRNIGGEFRGRRHGSCPMRKAQHS